MPEIASASIGFPETALRLPAVQQALVSDLGIDQSTLEAMVNRSKTMTVNNILSWRDDGLHVLEHPAAPAGRFPAIEQALQDGRIAFDRFTLPDDAQTDCPWTYCFFRPRGRHSPQIVEVLSDDGLGPVVRPWVIRAVIKQSESSTAAGLAAELEQAIQTSEPDSRIHAYA